MTATAHVRPEPPRQVDDDLVGPAWELAFTVRWPFRWRGLLEGARVATTRHERLWIRVPRAFEPAPEAIGDAALLTTLFPALRRAAVLHVHGEVAAGRLEGVARLVEAWRGRRPDKYRRSLPVVADGERGGAVAAGPRVLTFSGGLDSCYALREVTRRDRSPGDPALLAAVMISGADIPWDRAEAFRRAAARAKAVTDDRGAPLLRLRTNVRTTKQNWTHSSNTALVAALGLLRPAAAGAWLAVGYRPDEARRFWPADVEDPPLLDVPTFRVGPAGEGADRFEKAETVLGWPAAAHHLRVCFAPGVWDRNCGRCPKCLAVLLFVRLLGGVLPAFSRAFADDDLDVLFAQKTPFYVARLGQALRHARARGSVDPLLPRIEAWLAQRGHGAAT